VSTVGVRLSLALSNMLRRVGYGHEKESGDVIIPSTVESLLEDYEVDIAENPGLTWDFMWNANVAEGREKGFVRQPFSQTLEIIPTAIEATTCSVVLAEAALKVSDYSMDLILPTDDVLR